MYFAFWNRFRFGFCPVCELFLSFICLLLFHDFYINFAVVISTAGSLCLCVNLFKMVQTWSKTCTTYS